MDVIAHVKDLNSKRLAAWSEGKRLLDFGCGYGQGAQYLAEAGWEWTGTDLEFRGITHAMPIPQGGCWVSIEGLKKAIDDGAQWDVVCLSNVLNVQRTEEELADTIKLACAALKPGGFLVWNYPATPRYLPWFGIGMMRAAVDLHLNRLVDGLFHYSVKEMLVVQQKLRFEDV
jgi:2-polyprenyl-3-methyl-5-hydroxy-6-metoxy-1,4-benzoquinol methylase